MEEDTAKTDVLRRKRASETTDKRIGFGAFISSFGIFCLAFYLRLTQLRRFENKKER